MANVYKKGQTIRCTATFTVAGVATDPTTVTLKIRAPDGTTTTYLYSLGEIVKSATGMYYKDIDVSANGRWDWHWEGTGTVDAVDEDWFWVEGVL